MNKPCCSQLQECPKSLDETSLGGFPRRLSGKEPACKAGVTGDVGLIPTSGRFLRGVHGNPLQYSCLENPMDRGAWWVTVHGVTQSQTRLKQFSMHAHKAQEDMGIKLCVAVGAGQPDALLCPPLLWACRAGILKLQGK